MLDDIKWFYKFMLEMNSKEYFSEKYQVTWGQPLAEIFLP